MGATFFICLAVVLLIGLSSARQAKASAADYFVASRSVPPWLVGLSAVATNNSGYMFIGLIGYTYTAGVQSVWLMLGWIVGDLIASKTAHERMRDEADRIHANGIISLLARWGGTNNRSWQVLAALFSIVFLATYAAAQIAAGGKALEGMLDIPMAIGMSMVAVVVIAYSIAGGIRASIWTDVAQSLLMIVSIVVLLVAAVTHLGGMQAVFQQAAAIDGFMNPTPTGLDIPGYAGAVAFVVGWMFAGAAALGQPHIVSRYLALQNTRQMNQVRWWYYSYYLLFYCFATAVGLLSRLYFGETSGFDPEMALPNMARDLLPPWLAGLMLAGIFAATMSTADSLVLSCSSAITQDLPRKPSENRWFLKAATAMTTVFALGIGLWSEQSVFSLVVWAWGTLGAVFVPILIWQVLGAKLNSLAMLSMSSTGVMTTVAWKFYGFPNTVYEGAVGIFSAFVLGAIFTISSIRSRFNP
ncbi:sodium/proline symporter [Limnobacter sp. P1]|uniref:sodium/proline symporter n=1 Tax=Limnobacter olei TaxID=3031298 RepID=UPI0023B0F3D4|nr:sodium/proline symporter [Limnobacter sp. P1]